MMVTVMLVYVGLCIVCYGYSNVSVHRYVWYVIVTAMLVCVGMCGM